MNRAERRRTERQLKQRGLYRRQQLLVIGDPRSDIEIGRLLRQHEADLADPTLSAGLRRELEESLARVKLMQLVLAQCDPKRPATPAEAH